MKENYIIANEGLTMVNGELVSVKFNRVSVSEGHVFYDTDKYGTLKDIKTYSDANAFERGKTSEHVSSLTGAVFNEDKMVIYKMVDGEPKWELAEVEFEEKWGHALWPVLPDGIYASREDCLRNSTYIEVGADGERVEHTGILKKIRLTDEQREFIHSTLKPAMEKAKELGIVLIADYREDVKAFNGKMFNMVQYDCYAPDDVFQHAGMDDLETVCPGGITVVSDDIVIYDENR